MSDRSWEDLEGRRTPLCGSAAKSDLRSLRQFEGVFHVNAEVADGALDLGMPEQDLNGAQVARRLVDDGRFRTSKRVGAVLLGLKTDAGDPFPHEPCVLPRAHVTHVVVPAWKDEVGECAAAALEPCQQGLAGRL